MKNIINSLSRLQKKLLAITFDTVLSVTATSFAIFIYFNILHSLTLAWLEFIYFLSSILLSHSQYLFV